MIGYMIHKEFCNNIQGMQPICSESINVFSMATTGIGRQNREHFVRLLVYLVAEKMERCVCFFSNSSLHLMLVIWPLTA